MTSPKLERKLSGLGSGRSERKGSVLFTKAGDGGQSQTLSSRPKRSKSSIDFHVLGELDELSAHFGVVLSLPDPLPEEWVATLKAMQCTLLDIGSAVAKELDFDIGGELCSDLEKKIISLQNQAPPLRNFILPGGGMASAQLHVARAVCRRLERFVVTMHSDVYECPGLMRFINRTSDFVFALARLATVHCHAEEVQYSPKLGILNERT